MATSGTISLTLGGGVRAVLNWSLNRQSGMQSTIWYDVTWSYTGSKAITLSGDVYLHTNSTSKSLIADGFTQYSAGQRITSGYVTVNRDPATNIGTLTLGLSSSSGEYWYDGNNYDGEHSYSGKSDVRNWTINTTTPAGTPAQITAVSDFTDETSPTITYLYDRGMNVDSVSILAGISFTGEKMDIPYREVDSAGTSYTFNFTQSELDTLYTLLKNGNTASVRFYLQTIETIDGEIMNLTPGYITKTFSFVNYTPLLTPTLTDTNDVTYALTGNRSHIVKYFSKVAYNMNVELRKGALDVIGCYIQNGGRIEEGFTESTFENPTSNVFYFSATDDRGYTGTASKSLSLFDGEFIDYIKLTTSIKSTPISAEGNMSFTITGKYFNANFGAAQNKLVVQYAVYKKGTTPSWSTATEVTPEMLDNTTYEVSFSQSGLDYTAQYVVAVKVNDLLMNGEASVSVVAKPVFYWNADKFIFNVPVTFNEGLSGAYEDGTATGYYMNSSGQYSSGGYSWAYRKWADGTLECWCSVPISTTVNTAWGNMYVAAVSNIYKTDLSYPVQLVGTPVVIVTLGAGGTKGMLIADNSYAADNISTGRYNIASPVSITSNATFRLNYYVRGKWK